MTWKLSPNTRPRKCNWNNDLTKGVMKFLRKEQFIFRRTTVQTGSGAHPASYPMGTGGPFPGGKGRPGRNADHSPPSSAEVKYE
jgi:hypothetical protein